MKTLALRIFFNLFLLAPISFADDKLNVILIMADDSAVDNYGCYGSKFFSTPRLDALAKTGAMFNHCYSEPVCTSSRVKIMTGRDGIRNYVQFGTLDKDEITFAHMVKDAGYATAVAGKWQLHNGNRGTRAPESGFDNYCLWNYPGTTRSRFWHPSLVRDGETMFFAYYPMLLVHSPFVATPDSNSNDQRSESKSLNYFRDMTLYADKCVGKIVDALEKNKLREKTVIIYTTDNGTHRSLTYPYGKEKRSGEKALATDGGTHAPLIVNCPGTVPEGIVVNDLVDFSDFLPTIADITNAKLPKVKLDGRSFWPQCKGKQGNPRKYIFQYYYPKFKPAAEKHGQGVNGLEIVWAQNQRHKLYRDGTLYALSDRMEENPIKSGVGTTAEIDRKLLQEAIDLMPKKAAKLNPVK